jgi:hypothetical protein
MAMKKNRQANIANYKSTIGKNYIDSRSRIRVRHLGHIRNIISVPTISFTGRMPITYLCTLMTTTSK